MKKTFYEQPALEIIRLQGSDILCSSNTESTETQQGDNEGGFTPDNG